MGAGPIQKCFAAIRINVLIIIPTGAIPTTGWGVVWGMPIYKSEGPIVVLYAIQTHHLPTQPTLHHFDTTLPHQPFYPTHPTHLYHSQSCPNHNHN